MTAIGGGWGLGEYWDAFHFDVWVRCKQGFSFVLEVCFSVKIFWNQSAGLVNHGLPFRGWPRTEYIARINKLKNTMIVWENVTISYILHFCVWPWAAGEMDRTLFCSISTLSLLIKIEVHHINYKNHYDYRTHSSKKRKSLESLALSDCIIREFFFTKNGICRNLRTSEKCMFQKVGFSVVVAKIGLWLTSGSVWK